MSKLSIDDTKKSMKQPSDDLSKAMGQLSVNTDDNEKTSPSLSDMPIDVVALITEKLDFKHQLKLRKVSKSLRALVDKLKPACKSIKVELWRQGIIIAFNNHFVMYTDDKDMFVGYADGTEYMNRRDDFLKVAFDDLASALKNSKLQLEELSFRFSYAEEYDIKRFFNEIQKVLESLNHQLPVKQVGLRVFRPSTFLSILPFLKPGVLEKISLDLYSEDDLRIGMDKVALLEQWKQLEELVLWDCFERFPMEYATHFKRFWIFKPVIDIETFDRIKDFVSKLDNFEYCRIAHLNGNIDDVQRMAMIPVSSDMNHYSIPDSDSCLEFSFVPGVITIVEKKCHLH